MTTGRHQPHRLETTACHQPVRMLTTSYYKSYYLKKKKKQKKKTRYLKNIGFMVFLPNDILIHVDTYFKFEVNCS